jgi:hypothetical protein
MGFRNSNILMPSDEFNRRLEHLAIFCRHVGAIRRISAIRLNQLLA